MNIQNFKSHVEKEIKRLHHIKKMAKALLALRVISLVALFSTLVVPNNTLALIAVAVYWVSYLLWGEYRTNELEIRIDRLERLCLSLILSKNPNPPKEDQDHADKNSNDD